jgi:hypothetical protein
MDGASRNRRWGCKVLLAAVAAIALIWGYSQIECNRRARAALPCGTNMQQLVEAVLVYASDHGERLPTMQAYPDGLLPYLPRGRTTFHCPLDRHRGAVSYAYHPRWAGHTLQSLEMPACSILLYEADGRTPVYRHNDCIMVGWADGHRKCTGRVPLGPEVIIDGLAR